MREIRIRSKVFGYKQVKVYETIKELPIRRYNELQKMFLMDAQIGTDMEAVASHFQTLHTLLSAGETEKAAQEAKNLHNNFFYILQGVTFKSHMFAAMVYSINGRIIDFEKEAETLAMELEEIGMTQEMVEAETEELKKKLVTNWEPTFLTDLEMEEIMKRYTGI
jgi:hypothetical protein